METIDKSQGVYYNVCYLGLNLEREVKMSKMGEIAYLVNKDNTNYRQMSFTEYLEDKIDILIENNQLGGDNDTRT